MYNDCREVQRLNSETDSPARLYIEDVIFVPGTEAYNKAREAVQRGVATELQKDLVAKEAKQTGSRGKAAQDALK